MKFLLVILLSGFAIASGAPYFTSTNYLTSSDIDDFLTELVLETEGNKSLEEVQKQLKERLNKILEKIKDAIDHGKSIKEDMLTKVKELREKMKDLKIDLDDKNKENLERLKEKGRDFLKKILEKLGLSRRAILLQVEEDSVQALKDAFESGTGIKDSLEKFLDDSKMTLEDLAEALEFFRE